jgi:hypothetical protein
MIDSKRRRRTDTRIKATEMKRVGCQAAGKGAADWFTGTVTVDYAP